MTITVTLSNHAAIFTLSAIEAKVEKIRKYCEETDKEFGYMNNIHKDAVDSLREAHATMLSELRKFGYVLAQNDIPDSPFDEKIEP